MRFREKFSDEERQNKSKTLLGKYPDRIPVIVEKDSSCRLQEMSSSKMLIPQHMNMGQLAMIIRKKIELTSEQGLFFLVNDQLIPVSQNMLQIYNTEKDPDGFLYIIYTAENTFG
jgi:GABA(A) receptor-associated protein